MDQQQGQQIDRAGDHEDGRIGPDLLQHLADIFGEDHAADAAQHTADADDRAQVGHLAEAVQAATGDNVDLAYVDQGYTGEKPAKAAREHGIELEVFKLPEAKRGFVLLPRRWVVERSFAWATRFRRLVKDYGRYPSTLADLHILAFVCLMLKQAAQLASGS